MNDPKLEERKNNFQKTNKSMLEARENFKLSLRKEKIDSFITQRREIDRDSMKVDNNKIHYSIDPQNLKIDEETINKNFNSIEEFAQGLKEYILMDTTEKLDYVKLGVYLIRVYITRDTKAFTAYFYQWDVYQVLNDLLKRMMSDNTIVFEILWIYSTATLTDSNEILEMFYSDAFIQNYKEVYSLYSNDFPMLDQLVWNLGNIIGDSIKARNSLIDNKLFEMVLQDILKKDLSLTKIDMALAKTSIWFISNALKLRPQIEKDLLILSCETLILYAKIDDNEILNDVMWAFSFTSNTDDQDIIDLFVKSDICKFIIYNEKMNRPNFILPCIRFFGNLLACNIETGDYLLKIGCIPYLQKFLYNKNSQVRKEVLWALSNITAGTVRQIKIFMNSGIIPIILALTRDSDFDVVRESIYTIGNIVKGGDYQCCLELVNMNFIDTIIFILNNFKDISCLEIILDVLAILLLTDYENRSDQFTQLFIHKGGTEILEKLQYEKNETIYNIVRKILDQFFKVDILK